MSIRFKDLELLDAVRRFTIEHSHPAIDRFKAAMRDWGDEWRAVTPAYHAAAEHLTGFTAEPDCLPLLQAFAASQERLHWEQSYRREQKLVPAAMLDGYAFAEVIGKQGPFVSDRIRAGIGVWGPEIIYPRHRHRAEEIYVVLAGDATFEIGDAPACRPSRGDVIFVAADTPHGFVTGAEALALLYLWQAGDLRQQSSFG